MAKIKIDGQITSLIQFLNEVIESGKFSNEDPIYVFAVKKIESETKKNTKVAKAVAKKQKEINEPMEKAIMKLMGKTHSTYTTADLLEMVNWDEYGVTELPTRQKISAILRPYVEKGIVVKENSKWGVCYKRIPMSKVGA